MFKNLVYSLITKAGIALINFSILVISSRYLGVSSRGEISIFILNITIIQVINEVYTGYSIVHFIPKFNFRKIIISGFIYTLIFCSLSNVVLVFLNKQVQGYEWLGYLISLLVILNTFNCVLILGKENIRAFSFLSFLQPFILLTGIIFCVFILKKDTFVAYVYPLLISFIIGFTASTALVSNYFFKGNTITEFKTSGIFAKGFAFQVSILMFLFANRYSYYLLPDSASVGMYSSSVSLMESVLIIANSISPVLLSRVANQGNTPASANITLTLSKTSLFLTAIAAVVVFSIPERVFTNLLGSSFSGIKQSMIQYSPTVLMVSLFSLISQYFSAIGKQKIVFFCYALGFFSTIFLAPYLVQAYGTKGAAYNANIAYFIITLTIGTAFLLFNKMGIRTLFTCGNDLKNLRKLIVTE